MRSVFVLFAALVVLNPAPARSEANEMAVGAHGGLQLLSFRSKGEAAISTATWYVGAHASYGILDDLSLMVRFTFSTCGAETAGYEVRHAGLDYEGLLKFDTMQFHPELGLQYKIYAGYNLAPYLEASVGYIWSHYRTSGFYNQDGLLYGIEVDDFSEEATTFSVGLSVDYRLFDLLFVGAGVHYIFIPGAHVLEHTIRIPLSVACYW